MGWSIDNSQVAAEAAEAAEAERLLTKAEREATEVVRLETLAVKEANKTKYLPSVSTVALRISTYPNPLNGDTVKVTGDSSMYRFQTGTGWVKTDEYNPTAIDNVTAQLAEKATAVEMNAKLNDIGVNQINKNKGLIDQTYLSDALKQQIAGTAPINAIPADYSLTEKKFAIPVLQGVVSRNLFNKNTVTPNLYINPDTGIPTVPTDGSVVSVSDFMLVEGSTPYIIKRPFFMHGSIYDQNKVFLQAITAASFTTPAAGLYIRISCLDSNLNWQQVEKGSVGTPYVPYGVTLKDAGVLNNEVSGSKLKTGTVTEEKLNFTPITGVKGKNLFNKVNTAPNKYINPVNGEVLTPTDGSILSASEFIYVGSNQPIALTNIMYSYSAIYDEVGSYISAIPTSNFTTPANGAYIRVSIFDVNLGSAQIEKGTVPTPYESYGNKVEEGNLPMIPGSKVLPASITEDRLSFAFAKATKGKNLFNKDATTPNKYINPKNGDMITPTDGSILSASEFIYVGSNQPIALTNVTYQYGAIYTDTKAFISSIPGLTFTSPVNGAYIRVSVYTSNLGIAQIEKGSVATSFESYRFTLDSNVLVASEVYSETKNRLLLPPKMFFVQGERLPLYKSNILASVSKPNDFFKTAISSVSATNKPLYRYFLEDILLDSSDLGASFRVNTKQYDNQLYNYYNDVIAVSTAATATGKTPKILNIGDSLTNRNIPQKLHDRLVTYGATPTMLGTMANGGRSGEGREGWEFENFIGMDNTYGATAITRQTAPGAGSLTTNPFLKLADATDTADHPNWCFRNTGSNQELSYATDTDKTGDFYIFDFAYYLTTQGFALPNVVTIALSTNDIWQDTTDALAQSRLALEIMIKQIKKAAPSCKIGVIPCPAWGSNDAGNMNWVTYVVPWLENCMTDVITYQNTLTGLDIVPIWAHVNRDFNFAYSAVVNVSAINQSKKGTRTEYVHWDEAGKLEYINALNAYVMNVI